MQSATSRRPAHVPAPELGAPAPGARRARGKGLARSARALAALALPFLLAPAAAAEGELELTTVFRSGTGGYHTYRIPAIVRTPKGTLLAFAEGRRGGSGDSGDVDVVLRRSTDEGSTWGELAVVWDDGPHTCGNPAPVVDRASGRVHLFLTRNHGADDEAAILTGESREPRRVFLCSSADEGATWSPPRDLSETLRAEGWRWYATGPVHGIELERGAHRGRLVVPANHSSHATQAPDPETYRSHVLYSDDGGASWRRSAPLAPFTNESTVAELEDGRLRLDVRSYHGRGVRAFATSDDGGASWSGLAFDEELVAPVCQASLLRYSWSEEDASRLLFASPAGEERARLTVRLSTDEGESWPVSRVVWEGAAAYSDLARLGEGRIACLFEKDGYREIALARFDLAWLAGGD